MKQSKSLNILYFILFCNIIVLLLNSYIYFFSYPVDNIKKDIKILTKNNVNKNNNIKKIEKDKELFEDTNNDKVSLLNAWEKELKKIK